MQFSITDNTALKANIGDSFHFTPTAKTILLSNPHDISDFSTDGNRLDIFDFAYYLKIHTNLQLLVIFLRQTMISGRKSAISWNEIAHDIRTFCMVYNLL